MLETRAELQQTNVHQQPLTYTSEEAVTKQHKKHKPTLWQEGTSYLARNLHNALTNTATSTIDSARTKDILCTYFKRLAVRNLLQGDDSALSIEKLGETGIFKETVTNTILRDSGINTDMIDTGQSEKDDLEIIEHIRNSSNSPDETAEFYKLLIETANSEKMQSHLKSHGYSKLVTIDGIGKVLKAIQDKSITASTVVKPVIICTTQTKKPNDTVEIKYCIKCQFTIRKEDLKSLEDDINSVNEDIQNYSYLQRKQKFHVDTKHIRELEQLNKSHKKQDKSCTYCDPEVLRRAQLATAVGVLKPVSIDEVIMRCTNRDAIEKIDNMFTQKTHKDVIRYFSEKISTPSLSVEDTDNELLLCELIIPENHRSFIHPYYANGDIIVNNLSAALQKQFNTEKVPIIQPSLYKDTETDSHEKETIEIINNQLSNLSELYRIGGEANKKKCIALANKLSSKRKQAAAKRHMQVGYITEEEDIKLKQLIKEMDANILAKEIYGSISEEQAGHMYQVNNVPSAISVMSSLGSMYEKAKLIQGEENEVTRNRINKKTLAKEKLSSNVKKRQAKKKTSWWKKENISEEIV